jgi:hypothetical protein
MAEKYYGPENHCTFEASKERDGWMQCQRYTHFPAGISAFGIH